MLVAVILVTTMTSAIAAAHCLAQSGRSPLLGDTLMRGITYAWQGDRSVALEHVEISLWRDDERIGRTFSDKDGEFRLTVKKGSPVIVTLEHEGYVQGKFICGRADEKELVIYPTLLPRGYARERWRKQFDRFFEE
jgi:hypothetical protein